MTPIENGLRWSIWIDIEGFGELWPRGDLGTFGLRALMQGIYRIGTQVYTEDSMRLFAHQFGDGFVIVADSHEEQLDRCTAIAVALMRHVSRAGCLARAAVAEGAFADISGLWPREIRGAVAVSAMDESVRLGSGLMTLLPVMGTALINANKLDAKNPSKGALLTVATNDAHRVPISFPRRTVEKRPDFTVIDWVHAASPILDQIDALSGIGARPAEVEQAIVAYIASEMPPSDWVVDTLTFNGIAYRGK